jgi:uncharacterized membrane protein YidH (DUF202 family)
MLRHHERTYAVLTRTLGVVAVVAAGLALIAYSLRHDELTRIIVEETDPSSLGMGVVLGGTLLLIGLTLDARREDSQRVGSGERSYYTQWLVLWLAVCGPVVGVVVAVLFDLAAAFGDYRLQRARGGSER